MLTVPLCTTCPYRVECREVALKAFVLSAFDPLLASFNQSISFPTIRELCYLVSINDTVLNRKSRWNLRNCTISLSSLVPYSRRALNYGVADK